jgi:hypothetical protein
LTENDKQYAWYYVLVHESIPHNIPSSSNGTAAGREYVDLTGKAHFLFLFCSSRVLIFFTFFFSTGVFSNSVDFIKPLQWLPTITQTRAHRVHDAPIGVISPMILRVKERLDSKQNVKELLGEDLVARTRKRGIGLGGPLFAHWCIHTFFFWLGKGGKCVMHLSA